MDIFIKNIKKAFLSVIFFTISLVSYAGTCDPITDPGCDEDLPLDSHVIILMIIVALFAIYSLNKKVIKVFN